MALYARIENSHVVEIITLSSNFHLAAIYPPAFVSACVPCGAEVKQGWVYDGASFAAPTPVVRPPQVPPSVTRAQAKIQLHRAGLLDTVKAAVAADPEVQIWFDEATLWYRDNPHVIALGESILMGGSLAIDEMFIAAAQIAA